MTAAESLYRRFGALELPLAERDPLEVGNLASLDPARDILLDLFAAALNSELGPVWASAANNTPLEGSDPVKTKLPGAVTPEALGEMKTGWPLLCLTRNSAPATLAQHGFYDQLLTQRWDVDYILCPLALTNLLRVQDILQAVGKIIMMVVDQGGHKAYRAVTTADGSTVAANVLSDGDDCCRFYSLRVAEMVIGPAQVAKDGPKYYACGLTLESRELTDNATGGDAAEGVFEGADYDIGIGGTPEGVIPGLLYASTDPPVQRG